MIKSAESRFAALRRSRKLLQNPYAHIEEIVEFPRSTHDMRRALENPYAFLGTDGKYEGWPLADPQPVPSKRKLPTALDATKGRTKPLSRQRIEAIVKNIQSEMWRRFVTPSANPSPEAPLDPELPLKCLGYSINYVDSLGLSMDPGDPYEVAGLFDADSKAILISRQFPPEVRRFTIAHELGHAVLHDQSGLHRDRPTDGTRKANFRDQREVEADLFASLYLLPEKLIKEAFSRKFLTECFAINEATAFALGFRNADELRKKHKTRRSLSRHLASNNFFNGTVSTSLAEQFGVSQEAMAIRLEELNLV
jgi:Zn-dependent peptidase ImmA (M78 family)